MVFCEGISAESECDLDWVYCDLTSLSINLYLKILPELQLVLVDS